MQSAQTPSFSCAMQFWPGFIQSHCCNNLWYVQILYFSSVLLKLGKISSGSFIHTHILMSNQHYLVLPCFKPIIKSMQQLQNFQWCPCCIDNIFLISGRFYVLLNLFLYIEIHFRPNWMLNNWKALGISDVIVKVMNIEVMQQGNFFCASQPLLLHFIYKSKFYCYKKNLGHLFLNRPLHWKR